MKIKGISPFERNVEKIVLGAVAVAFLAVVALQFVYQPNMITVDGKSVPPQESYRDLQQKAEALTAAMILTDPPPPPEGSKVDLLARFQAGVQNDVAPKPVLSWVPPGVDLGVKGDDRHNALGASIAEVVPPAPTRPIASVFSASIHPGEVAEMPDLAKWVPAQQPYDKAAVTVEAVFDGAALRAALRADPDGESGVSPMPGAWWQDKVSILGVRLEREEQTPTGEWTNAMAVPGMPGRADFVTLATAEDVVRMPDLDSIITEAASSLEKARRPDYYRTIAGPAWITPKEAQEQAETGSSRTQIERILKNKAESTKQLAELEEQLKTAPDAGGDAKPDTKRDGGGGKNPRGPGPGPTAPAPDPKNKKSRPQLEREIKTATATIARQDRELQSLGYQVTENAATPGVAPRAKPLLDDAEIRVWAHDLTAEPGKTYRYRAQVVINNPAFDRAAFISAEQAKFAATPVLYSAPSEWTSPVVVDGTECFFIVGATEGGDGPLSGTRATAELYKFYYGFWRQGKVNLEPGDVLASNAKLPALFAYDMAKTGQDPAGPTGAPDSGGRRGTGVEPPPAPGQDQAAAPGQTALEREIPIVIDAILLDVSRVPGGWAPVGNRLANGVTPNQALLRGPGGQIVSRIPEQDRTSELYDRVSRSAKEGLTQGAPPAPKEEPGQDDKQQQKKPDDEPAPSKGGGGGGGGGG